MKIDWTPAGGSSVNLGDDSLKYGIVIEQIGASSLVQAEALAGAAAEALFPRGNVAGEIIFRSDKTYADYTTTFSTFKTIFGYLNQQGSLVITQGATTLTCANAILKSVQRIFDAQATGARMGIRYTFAITTIT
jgi:hypothetical protein